MGLYYQAIRVCFTEWAERRVYYPFLFFLLEGELLPQLIGTLNLFIEEGLGGERASGKELLRPGNMSHSHFLKKET